MMQREICTCCYLRTAPERFSLTDKRPPVCVECARHVGDALKRDREHLRDWRAAHQAAVASYESRLANMRTLQDGADVQIAELRSALSDAIETISSEYHKAPIGDLRNALETELVSEERSKAEFAFRIRSRAMGVIWRIDRLHNTLDGKSPETCKCGQRAERCAVLAALLPFVDELDQWEVREKDRMLAGKVHGLPPEHPEAKKFMQNSRRPWRGPGRYEDPLKPSIYGRR